MGIKCVFCVRTLLSEEERKLVGAKKANLKRATKAKAPQAAKAGKPSKRKASKASAPTTANPYALLSAKKFQKLSKSRAETVILSLFLDFSPLPSVTSLRKQSFFFWTCANSGNRKETCMTLMNSEIFFNLLELMTFSTSLSFLDNFCFSSSFLFFFFSRSPPQNEEARYSFQRWG